MTPAQSTRPYVTFLMPAYNAAAYVRQAVESVLVQTWHDFELIVIDDGSSDETPEILASLAATDARVRIIRHDTNAGAPRRRNEGVQMARGTYLAMMDADDFCTPDRLARQVAYLDAHTDIDVVACRYHLADEHGTTLKPDRLRQFLTPDEIRVQMLFFCPVHHSTLMARTAVFAAFKYDEDFPVAQDYELWSRMSRSHRFAVLPERLMYYRRHTGQVTSAKSLVRTKSHAVQARQLERLGIDFDTADVVRHDYLARFKGREVFLQQSGQALDMAFVRWARTWLEGLVRANAAHGLYPEPTFSRIVGERWWLLCQKAAGGGLRAAVIREWAASSLKLATVRAWLHRPHDAQRARGSTRAL